jgi:hypothetical protein
VPQALYESIEFLDPGSPICVARDFLFLQMLIQLRG